MGSVLGTGIKGTFGGLFSGLIFLGLGMAVLNLIFLIMAKIRKKECNAFALIFSVTVAIFNVAFSLMFTSDKGEVHTTNNLSPEIILFLFLSLFTLAVYALTLGSMDSVFATEGQNSGSYYIFRNILNGVVGAGLIVLGIHLLNLDGKYTDGKGRLIVSHERELNLVGIVMLLIGFMSFLYAVKRKVHKVTIDEADRMIGRGKSASGEWQAGETLPIYDSLLRYETVGMIFDSITTIVILGLFLYFLFSIIRDIFFVIPASLVIIVILSLVIINVVNKTRYLKMYQFRWRYGKITGKEEQQEKQTSTYQGEVRITTTTHYYIVLDNREKIEVDHESNTKYGAGAEVFVLDIFREQKEGAVDDLSAQISTYAGKCLLYG